MRTLILTATVLLATLSLHSQERQGGPRLTAEEIAQRNTEWMTTELKLTAEQKAPVDSINLLFAQAQLVIFQSADGDREKIRETMTALNLEKEKALAGILTESQMADYKKTATSRGRRR
ncbi:MAG: DUF4890 domain-containing protein [Tannerella sp.]|jgi:hypothetical protein|nr:DUF4890 domain-containing protein [Tannerella sp.]